MPQPPLSGLLLSPAEIEAYISTGSDAAFLHDGQCILGFDMAAGGDLYVDLRRRGGKYEEALTSAGVLKPCLEALMYLNSKVP